MTKIEVALAKALEAIDEMVAADPALAAYANEAKQGLIDAAALAARG